MSSTEEKILHTLAEQTERVKQPERKGAISPIANMELFVRQTTKVSETFEYTDASGNVVWNRCVQKETHAPKRQVPKRNVPGIVRDIKKASDQKGMGANSSLTTTHTAAETESSHSEGISSPAKSTATPGV